MNNGIYIVIPFITKEKAERKMDQIWEMLGLTGLVISNEPKLDEIYNKKDQGNG